MGQTSVCPYIWWLGVIQTITIYINHIMYYNQFTNNRKEVVSALNNFNILVGGEAGQGLVSVSNMLIKAVAKQGWYLFAQQDYMSRIRGGHNFLRLRISDTPVYCCERGVDLLVALDQESLTQHQQELNEGAVAIADAQLAYSKEHEHFIGISFADVATNQGQPKIMANAVAAGAVWAFLADNLTAIEDVIKETFAAKGEAIVDGNIRCAEAGFNLVRTNRQQFVHPPKPQTHNELMVLKCNDALPSGSLAA